MDVILLGMLAFGASVLTFYSGFGLGTILTPVFILFFPAEIAVALTAIIHFINNTAKLALTWKDMDRRIVLRFGIFAVLFAYLGAWCLNFLTHDHVLFSYNFDTKVIQVSSLNALLGLLILAFTLIEWLPASQKLQFSPNLLWLGGALSGFFGGFAGFQGALRSMFLIKLGLPKRTFIASGIAIACLIDVSRLSVYYNFFRTGLPENALPFLAVGSIAALAGAVLGNRLLEKMTLGGVQSIVSISLIIFALCLLTGLIG
jgi:uncharacterized membrane protein YfcA